MDLRKRRQMTYVDRDARRILQSRRLQRRRRRRMRRMASFLLFFVVVSLVTLSLTVFFKTKTITAIGSTHYTQEELVAASGVQMGDNLILLNAKKAGTAVSDAFVYVEETRVKKRLFAGEVVITVTEAEPFCALESSDGNYYLVSRRGTVLERLSTPPADIQVVYGIDLAGMKPGHVLQQNESEQLRVFTQICDALEESPIPFITRIDVHDILNIELTYQDRITIACGTEVELAYKFRFAQAVIADDIGENERGTLDVSYCHTTQNASFSPERLEMLPEGEENDPENEENSSEEASE